MSRLNKKAGIEEVLEEVISNESSLVDRSKFLLLLELTDVLDKIDAASKSDAKFGEIVDKLELFPYGIKDLSNKLDHLIGYMDFFEK